MEVMGLMLGEFVDDYTVRVVDVFAMPQSGTGVSVEAVDPVFQTKMMDMLRQTGRFVGKGLFENLEADGNPDPRPLWDGIILTLALAAGYRPWISIHNNPSSSLHLVPLPSSLIPYNLSKEKLSLMRSD